MLGAQVLQIDEQTEVMARQGGGIGTTLAPENIVRPEQQKICITRCVDVGGVLSFCEHTEGYVIEIRVFSVD